MTASMRRTMLAVACLLLLLAAAPAQAATRNQIIKDCADDGILEGSYSPSELRDARQNLPSDVAEYTDCADVLRRAELPTGGGGGGGGGGTGGGTPTGGGPGGGGVAPTAGGGGGLLQPQTPADQDAIDRALAGGDQPVVVGGRRLVPGAGGLAATAVRNDVPGTLVVALVGLCLAGLALAVPGLRRLVPLIGRRLR